MVICNLTEWLLIVVVETPYEVYWKTDFNTGSSHTKKMWRRENYQHKMKGEFRKNDIQGAL